jgi:hypothetical protein
MNKTFLALVCGLFTISASACDESGQLNPEGDQASLKSASALTIPGPNTPPITAPAFRIGTTRGELDIESPGPNAVFAACQTGPAVAGYGPIGLLGITWISGLGGVEGKTDNPRAYGVFSENTAGGYASYALGMSYVSLDLKVDGDIDGENNHWGASSGAINCLNDGVTICSCPDGFFQTGTVFSATGVSKIICNQL